MLTSECGLGAVNCFSRLFFLLAVGLGIELSHVWFSPVVLLPTLNPSCCPQKRGRGC